MDDDSKWNTHGRDQWNEKAEFWDRLHGDRGNAFSRMIVEPAVERLLGLRRGEHVVDAACGNGALARRLAAWGARVHAFDFSERLIDFARARDKGEPIEYVVADATDEAAIARMGEQTFDSAICTMAFMDMPNITPLCRGIHRLLRDGGRFVFVTAHPIFDTAGPIRVVEQEDRDGAIARLHALKLTRYLCATRSRAVGARDEPTPHNFYHRPLHDLLGQAFAAGFVLEALEEPGFLPTVAGEARREGQDEFWQFPPVLAGRFRKPTPTAEA